MNSNNNSSSSVVDFYRGKCILLTGATGFVGKVLLEKLLRSCPGLGRIYLLMRSGRDGKPPSARLSDLLKSRAFSFGLSPLAFEKVTVVPGDMNKPGLALSQEDRQLLIANVNVVFHVAAKVTFHGPMKEYMTQNVLGTENIMKLCEEMANVQSIIYVSTAYANCNFKTIEEKVYPLEWPVQELIDQIMMENGNETLSEGHPKLLARPNMYTASKAIAENLVHHKYGHLPVVICRPSSVTHAYKDPVQGWCDSLNAGGGIMMLFYMGICRTIEINSQAIIDIIPVDYVANALIVSSWHAATRPADQRKSVIHITSGERNPITFKEAIAHSHAMAVKHPSMKMVRPPVSKAPSNTNHVWSKLNHLWVKFFSHFLFAYLFDACLMACGSKAFMTKVTQKMHRDYDSIKHFFTHEWHFQAGNYLAIHQLLSPEEQRLFESDIRKLNWPEYLEALTLGSRRYLLNESDTTIEMAKRRLNQLSAVYAFIDTVVYLSVTGLILYFGNMLYNLCYC